MLMKSTVHKNPVAPWGTRYVNSPGVTQSVRLSVDASGAGEWGTEFPVPSIRFNFSSPIFLMLSQAGTTMDLADGKWHHVVAVKDGAEEVAVTGKGVDTLRECTQTIGPRITKSTADASPIEPPITAPRVVSFFQ